MADVVGGGSEYYSEHISYSRHKRNTYIYKDKDFLYQFDYVETSDLVYKHCLEIVTIRQVKHKYCVDLCILHGSEHLVITRTINTVEGAI